MADFTAPSWLDGQSASAINKRMMDELPSDIDKTEAGFPWDFTMPTALELAELLEYYIPETIKLMFPQYAYGEWLDLHAECVGLTRKSATYAVTSVDIVGTAGTVISAGFAFAVPADGDNAAIEFVTDEEVTLDDDGTGSVGVTAVEAGVSGNVAANTIVIMVQPLSGISSVTNPEAATGGVAEEDDESLRERINEFNQQSTYSFVGCNADYIRWAKEVDGVGEAYVIPEWNGAGTVKLIVVDGNGDPAADSILTAVYDYIMSPDDPTQRLAPVGAVLTVVSPESVYIEYTVTLELESGYNESDVIAAFKENLTAYYTEARNENEVKYTRVGSVLSETAGVNDYSNLLMKSSTAEEYSTDNIDISEAQYPITKSINDVVYVED